MDTQAGLAWLLAIVLAGGSLLLHEQWPAISGGRKCDAAIKEQLKAPATYERVNQLALSSDGSSFLITYQAQNDYGVPLRRKVQCEIQDGLATVNMTGAG